MISCVYFPHSRCLATELVYLCISMYIYISIYIYVYVDYNVFGYTIPHTEDLGDASSVRGTLHHSLERTSPEC